MGCSGPCITCGNHLGGCMVAHDEDFYYIASKEELMRRLDVYGRFLDESDKNKIQKEIEIYEIKEKYDKR